MRGISCMIGEREYYFTFTLSVIEQIQDHYDEPLDKCMARLRDERKFIEAVWTIALILINDEIEYSNSVNGTDEPMMTRKQLGWELEFKNVSTVLNTIWKAYAEAFPKEESANPNARRRSPKSLTLSDSSLLARLSSIFRKAE